MNDTTLRDLDQLRYDHPLEALEKITFFFGGLRKELKARALGIAASSYRMLFRIHDAKCCISEGLRWAYLLDDQVSKGDLLNRSAYVLQDDGDLGSAILAAEASRDHYLSAGRLSLAGQSLFIKGNMQFYSGTIEKAIVTWNGSIRLLDDEDLSFRCAVFHGLANAFKELGDLGNAEVFARKAAEEARQGILPQYSIAHLYWLSGELAEENGDLTQAEESLQAALQVYLPAVPNNSALVAISLVRVQLLNGKPSEAFQTALSMIKLMEPLRHNRVVNAAISALYRGGEQALSLDLVRKAEQRIRAELRDDRQPGQSLQ